MQTGEALFALHLFCLTPTRTHSPATLVPSLSQGDPNAQGWGALVPPLAVSSWLE